MLKDNFSKESIPIFFKSKDYTFLILGSDKSAFQIVTDLIENYYECKLKVISPNFNEDWKLLEQSNQQIELKQTHFNDYFLSDVDFVITTTINEALFLEIKAASQLKNIPLFAKNFILESDFVLGSSVLKGNIKISVSSFSANDSL